jgi:hypothetical protein
VSVTMRESVGPAPGAQGPSVNEGRIHSGA